MSLELLDKTRRMNRFLAMGESEIIDFTAFCSELSQTLEADVLLVSRKGKVLGLKHRKEISVIPQLKKIQYGDYLETSLQARFMNILSTKENVNLLTLGFAGENIMQYEAMISPISMAGERLGTLFVYRQEKAFSIDDIILTEYSTTVIGLAMQRALSEETSIEQQKENDVMAAIHTLSKLEGRALLSVLNALDGKKKGTLVTSRLSDEVKITRSVIVNALKKCESAGLIHTKSSGMKGTMVEIVNDLFSYEFLKKAMEQV